MDSHFPASSDTNAGIHPSAPSFVQKKSDLPEEPHRPELDQVTADSIRSNGELTANEEGDDEARLRRYVSAFRPTGTKRALLIGISYEGQTKKELYGCINDVKCMRHLLLSKFGFQDDNVRILADKDVEGRVGDPTKASIIHEMQQLVGNAGPGDTLFFHFCGHGTQVPDAEGDEYDAYDEAILPVDYKKQGEIVDDTLYAILVKGTPKKARLTAVLDCCHSGTGFDLPFLAADDSSNGYTVPEESMAKAPLHAIKLGLLQVLSDKGPQAALRDMIRVATWLVLRRKLKPHEPNPNAGEVLLFSGCRDHELSADTNVLSGGIITGAMTYSFITAVENAATRNQKWTYQQLLRNMRHQMNAARIRQTPQFSSSHAFDMNTVFEL